jgi:Flp pilus assembly protein TadD
MGTKVILSVAAILVVVLVIVVMQREEGSPEQPAQREAALAPEPSKENVSGVVREKIEHLREVVARNPRDTRSAFELARLLQDGHDLAGAITYYELGLKTAGKDTNARIDYSLCLYQSGREEEALAQNRIVLRLDGTNAKALYNLGALHANRGTVDSARFYWRSLRELHPNEELSRAAEKNLEELSGQRIP